MVNTFPPRHRSTFPQRLKYISDRGIHGYARCSDPALDVNEKVSGDIILVNRKATSIVVSLVVQSDIFPDLGGADQLRSELKAK